MPTIVGQDELAYRRDTCLNCGCINQYLPCEVLQKEIKDYVGDKDILNYILCANCGGTVQARNKRGSYYGNN